MYITITTITTRSKTMVRNRALRTPTVMNKGSHRSITT